MATLVLGAIGTVVAGPVGGALGALAGQAIDAQILRPKGREGPRLTELKVQTSSYGTPIAQLFGTMRVAGSVIWATDLIERATTEGGGKGRGATTSYAYSASFAVLLSARPIIGVGRIWADGKLLRGAAGDFKTATIFRLHTGGEDQAADPLIASAEGAALTPACRGQAYAVFEQLDLADFGNRIPSLSFEVIADPAPVSCGAVAEAVSGGVVGAGDAGLTIGGYAAHGPVRAIVDGVAEMAGAWLAESEAGLALHAGAGAADPATVEDRGAGAGGRGRRAIAAATTAPRIVTLQHYDPARDYQLGVQRASRPGAGLRLDRIEAPAAIAAEQAKAIAAAALGRADLARERRTIATDWRRIAIRPGERLRIAGESGLWRVTGWTLEAMVLSLDLSRIAPATVAIGATPGRVSAARDEIAGATVLHAFETPPIDDAILSAPRLTIAAAGIGAGWRSAALQMSGDGGATWTPIGATRGRAVLGHVAVAPARAPATLIDRGNSVEVVLANAAMTLADADASAIDAGANLALVGDEIIQFARAEPIGAARWRLSGLWRGRRGTDWAAGEAAAGDRFVLLDPATLVTVALPSEAIGSAVQVMAAGIGDGDDPAVAATAVTGASLVPPAPVHLRATPLGDGVTEIRWIRRSRLSGRWADRIDVPLIEEAEAYRVTIDGLSEISVNEASVVVPPGTATVAVRQIGTHGASRAATLTL